MRRIWLDTDLALGARRGDVDDGFALAAILAAPGVELLGVSTVFGNTDAATASANARSLLASAGRRAPVLEGAARTGQTTPAAEAIAALPAGSSLLALGPLTNLAAALALDPSLAERIELRAVGGNLDTWGRFPPYWPFEFNFAKDAAAARTVLDAPGLRRRLFPLDVCRRLAIGAAELLALRRRGGLARRLADGSWRWLAYAPLRYQRLRFPLWDLVPALDALGRLDATFAERRLTVDARGGLIPGAAPSQWARAIDAAGAWRSFIALLDGATSSPA